MEKTAVVSRVRVLNFQHVVQQLIGQPLRYRAYFDEKTVLSIDACYLGRMAYIICMARMTGLNNYQMALGTLVPNVTITRTDSQTARYRTNNCRIDNAYRPITDRTPNRHVFQIYVTQQLLSQSVMSQRFLAEKTDKPHHLLCDFPVPSNAGNVFFLPDDNACCSSSRLDSLLSAAIHASHLNVEEIVEYVRVKTNWNLMVMRLEPLHNEYSMV
ncbi:unnamed protein product [Spodoptera exigua]|nr:unnamed protein product [Spodoptera exigua]